MDTWMNNASQMRNEKCLKGDADFVKKEIRLKI